ncbi:uncharacterized protein LOC131459819 isoform X2 [Solea solea]|uniref:uncharacterized protein LOC131459819 isoform X2 n=1 Tax=Solea solea TaxID=90069 RepID=UPI00272DBDEB|nr:uncharacterized protein LOC131459819 isoform X2 [Solea solea]
MSLVREVRDDVNSRRSSTIKLLDTAFQQNANHDDDINTDSHMSNTSTNGEEELNNSSSEDKLSNENSSTTSDQLDMDNQEEHWSNTSNSEDEDNELNTENPTTSQLDVEISENEEALSHSEEDLTDSASNEGENHADDEDVMEGNSTREKTPEFPVVCRQWFNNTLLVVTVRPLQKIRAFGEILHNNNNNTTYTVCANCSCCYHPVSRYIVTVPTSSGEA